MAAVNSKYCCISVQQMLDEIAGANTPNQKVLDTYGFLSAINSDANLNGTDAIATKSAEGKARPTAISNRRVEIEYSVRQCEAVSREPTAFCTTRTDAPDDKLYESATVDHYGEVTWGLNKEEFRDLCENPNDRQRRLFANKVNDLKKDINEQLITAFIAGLGNYFTEAGAVPVDSAANPKTLNLFNTNATPNAMGLFPVFRDFTRSRWSGRPIAVGGTSLDAWRFASGIFNGNLDGLDINKQPLMMDIFSDYQVDPIFADTFEHLLTFAPGTVKMLEWDAFPEGSVYREMKEDYSKITMMVDGMSMDFETRYDECNSRWDFKLSKYFDLWKTPDTAFNEDCGQYSNGCLNWLIDCAALDCNVIKL